MIEGSLNRPYSFHRPSNTYIYTPLCIPSTIHPSTAPTRHIDGDDQPSTCKRYKLPTPSIPMDNDITKETKGIGSQVENRMTSVPFTTTGVEALDDNWQTNQHQIVSLEKSKGSRWEACNNYWENLELKQYNNYERIYLAQRFELQTQIRSVLDGEHPVLTDMEDDYIQQKQDLDIQRQSEEVSIDEMYNWEKTMIDNEAMAKIKNLDNELLSYINEKKRQLLIEADEKTHVPQDLLSLYQEYKPERKSIAQTMSRQTLLKQEYLIARSNDENESDLDAILKSITKLK
ncbi:hypothetical protein BC941DRAFT_412368 [Chlamydoabsidia padenii]|nr:hypothetical protein BC941DRAFT_412368 [Chlamydoabsidia padenii]